jgi:hypothetical protein
MIKTYLILVSAICFFALSGSSIYSQDGFREKIEDIKLDKLTAKLELDETTKETFIEKYKSFSRSMRSLNQLRAKTYKLMTENIESGNGLDTLVAKLLVYEAEISDKRSEFVNDMTTILTSQQVARMIVFERKFNGEIKKLLKQYQKNNRKERPFNDN